MVGGGDCVSDSLGGSGGEATTSTCSDFLRLASVAIDTSSDSMTAAAASSSGISSRRELCLCTSSESAITRISVSIVSCDTRTDLFDGDLSIGVVPLSTSSYKRKHISYDDFFYIPI